jgi:hypothetical protein
MGQRAHCLSFYYGSIILLSFSILSRITRVYAISRGCKIYPNKYAVWVEQKEVESNESLKKHAEITGVTEKIENTQMNEVSSKADPC